MRTETEKIYLDNSGRSTFCSCRKKYFLQNIQGLQPDTGSTALRYGSTWHGIQEGYYSHIISHGWPKNPEEEMEAISSGLILGSEIYQKESEKKSFYDDYKNFNTAVEGFSEYLDYFKDDPSYLEIIHTEKKFECPIEAENQTEASILSSIPEVIFTGKIDLCVKMDHIKWLLDFKTTGWILDQVISRANRSPQLIGYSYAGKKVLDFDPQGCLCSFSQVGSTKSRKTGQYGKVRHNFRRVPQIYTAEDIAAWKLSFIITARDIYNSLKEDLWPESFDNCYQYGACSYLKLCQQHSVFEDLNLEGFHVDHWNVLDE